MNVLTKLCLITVALFVLQVSGLPQRIKRQGFSWHNEDTDFGFDRRPSTSVTSSTSVPSSGTTTTTPSPRYSECIRQCPATPEYNPICGSNGVTYGNERKMQCANRCGLNVQKSFGGSCSRAG